MIDGRGVVADELAALRERYRERWGDDEAAGAADPFRVAVLALSAECHRATEAFGAEWEHQRGELRPAYPPRDGQPVTAWEEGPAAWTHRATGERLGPWDYYGRYDAVLVLEAAHGLAPGSLPIPRQMTKPDPWPGDPPAPEGA